MLPDVIPTSWKIAAVAVLVAATAAFTYHLTSNSYAEEVGGLKTALAAANEAGKAKDEAIKRNVKDLKDLRELVAVQNAGVEALRSAAKAEADRRDAEIKTLAAQRRKDAAKIAELRAIKAPVVTIDGVGLDEVKAELASCRRAVLINEADGE